MRARMLLVLACLAFAVLTLPIHGCGDNDNSNGTACCPVCGDGVCEQDEGCGCGVDCDVSCPGDPATCGNGVCERAGGPAESHETCPGDCLLDCRQCAPKTRVYVEGTITIGSKCPTGTVFAYRDADLIVCSTCSRTVDCGPGEVCLEHCGPGCEHDTGGCCPVRDCIDVID